MGNVLIKAAEDRSQISQFQAIEIAHNAFILKYNCIAGDCPQTLTLFPTIIGLNGNNNGKVECWYGGATVDECKTYFDSLMLANLINLSPPPPPTPTAHEYKSGKLRNGTIYVNYKDRYNAMPKESVAFIHLISFNSPWPNGPIITPEDAYRMDVKIDNGKAGSGKIIGINGSDSTDTPLSSCLNSGEYDLTQTGINCRLNYQAQ